MKRGTIAKLSSVSSPWDTRMDFVCRCPLANTLILAMSDDWQKPRITNLCTHRSTSPLIEKARVSHSFVNSQNFFHLRAHATALPAKYLAILHGLEHVCQLRDCAILPSAGSLVPVPPPRPPILTLTLANINEERHDRRVVVTDSLALGHRMGLVCRYSTLLLSSSQCLMIDRCRAPASPPSAARSISASAYAHTRSKSRKYLV